MKPEEIVKLADEAGATLRRAAKIVEEMGDHKFRDQLRAAAFDVETATVVRKLRGSRHSASVE